MGISFDYKFDKKETAPLFNKSKGSSKGRIHLLPYSGKRNSDIYAVAAKEINSPKPLGVIDKRFYILVKDPNKSDTYYKINKLSLKKRFGLSKETIQDISKSKITLEEAISNEINSTIKLPLTLLNVKIRDGQYIPIKKEEIEEIIKDVPPKYLDYLASKVIEETSLETTLKPSLHSVLDILNQYKS